MHNYLEGLKNEFDAEDGSFLINLRGGMIWDKHSFVWLVTLMQTCCKETNIEEKLDRWIAEGFWYIPQFSKDWSSHPNFPKHHSSKYYEKAYCLLDDLAYYFFTGNHPRIDKRDLVEVFIEETK
jgi:hypothetical protein